VAADDALSGRASGTCGTAAHARGTLRAGRNQSARQQASANQRQRKQCAAFAKKPGERPASNPILRVYSFARRQNPGGANSRFLLGAPPMPRDRQ
jgi:hypothetical protein